MKVRFEKSVMNDPTAWSVLDLIVQHFLDGRHAWDVDDLENIEQSQWIQTDIDGRAGKRNLEVLYKCYTDSVYPRHGSKMHSITITVTDHGKSDKELTPDDARSCLDMPAYIVVENSESDGAFIEAMIHALGRRELLDSHTEGWWDFEHLGGFGEIGKRIDQIIARTVGPLRIFVLADNDRLYPGQTTKTIQKIGLGEYVSADC
ncbi:MAG: hypothetical protein GY749_21040 [Desulfobacteraceae bacterium]|nr:hypothetical protein [Desulfobacteraceae bacterium]